jgi:sarcosine oxidase subunit beta
VANRYSIFSLLKESLRGHRGWAPAWRDPEPKPAYDFIVVGGGGHGLATAYYLAKNHNARNVAVLEKGYIGGGNVGRNTTIVRSNYLMPGNIPFYEHSLKLWEGLEQDINYNAMISQRGVLNLFHNDSQRDACVRRGNAMHLHGVDGELLNREQVRKLLPMADFDNARFPIMGGLMQRRGGTVRHDAVAWGFARAADSLGVDIIQNCEVTGIRQDDNGVTGVETTRRFIGSRRIGMACAGNTSRVASLAGLRLPIESHLLQAFVSEGLKPLVPCVITFGAGHFYISQSDKGGLVFGGSSTCTTRTPARQPAAGRGSLRGRRGAVSLPQSRADAALVGRHHGHVDGRLADHRPHGRRRPLSQCGLVLRRFQGYAGFRLVLRAPARHGPAPRGRPGLSARPLCHRPADRRERLGRAPQPTLNHAYPLPPLRSPHPRRIHVLR